MARSKKEYSEKIRLKILELHAKKLSNRQIAKELRISPSGVDYALRKSKRTDTIKDLPRSGRPHKILRNQLTQIELALKLGRVNNAADIRRMLLADEGVKISRQCILDTLKEDGYKVFPLQKKPYLTRKQKQDRLKKAHDWKKFTQQQWNSVVFSDETQFKRFATGNKKFVILPKNYPFTSRRAQATASHGGGSINVWAANTHRGVLAWAVFEGGLNAKKYIKILKTNLLKSGEEFFDEEPWVFQQDNDSAHVAGETIEWLEDIGESRGFHLLPWPSHSPDLNPIENLWARIDDILSNGPITKNIQELETRVGEIMEDLNANHADYFENLYESLPHRVNAVIANKGAQTTY